MDTYTQVVICYFIFYKMQNMLRFKFLKNLLTVPYHFIKPASSSCKENFKINLNKFKTININNALHGNKILIITKFKDKFSKDFYLEEDSESNFENLTLIENKENLTFCTNIQEITPYKILDYSNIIVDIESLTVYELKIIYDIIFFFMTFDDFKILCNKFNIIYIDCKNLEILNLRID